ncbi:MAG: hypothetical protein UT56_C0002G0025 [Candidatus Levybacteria bacterium GW2011_GWB1_39_7]|nr:MAG: hypothetical protein UT56_C0002G0025 [Candidatus Levybacteria bacterium GW2011_GWB1_39_7]
MSCVSGIILVLNEGKMKKNNKYSITIGWLYPDLMNTYGDRGNIIVLSKRAEWRGIKVKVLPINIESSQWSIVNCQLLFMGGAQDTQQEIVNRDLLGAKGRTLVSMIEKGIPGLFICGAYQFLGKYYITAGGKKLNGLGVFPLFTENPGEGAKRLIGNVLAEAVGSNTNPQPPNPNRLLVGFENHGGRTYLSDKNQAFAKVIKGHGNNGEDQTEGIHYKNAIGSYLHGPILPKNPELTDLLLALAFEEKYGKKFHLEPLDDSMEQKAREAIIEKIK